MQKPVFFAELIRLVSYVLKLAETVFNTWIFGNYDRKF